MYFMHYRRYDPMGQKLSTGGLTLAIDVAEDGTGKVGISQCGKADAFNKKIGRTIATQRLNSTNDKHVRVMEFPKDQPIKAMVHEAFKKDIHKLLAKARA